MPDEPKHMNEQENGVAKKNKENKDNDASVSTESPNATQTPETSTTSEPNSNADDQGGIDTAATSPEKDPPVKVGEGDAPAGVEAVPDPPVPNEAKEEEVVPDILYYLDYRDVTGLLIQRKKDCKPMDVNSLPQPNDKENVVVEKKPVLEIVTEISALINRSRRRYPVHRQRSPSTVSVSRSRSSSRSSSPRVVVRESSRVGGRRRARTASFHSSDDDETLEVSKVGNTTMIIHSAYLNNAIRKVVKYYPGASLHSKRLTFGAPYEMLIHHRKELEEYKTNHPSEHPHDYQEETNRHIDILLGFFEENFGAALRAEEERHKKDPPLCTFEYLWLLFKPGEEAYMTDSFNPNKKRAAVIFRVSKPRGFKYEINSFNIKYDGRMIDTSKWWSDLYTFEGEKEINQLILYPTKYHQEKLEAQENLPLRDKLVLNGKLYWKYCQQAYLEYSGKLADRGLNSKKFNGRVIIDVKAWNQFAAESPLPRPAPPGRRGTSRRRYIRPLQPPKVVVGPSKSPPTSSIIDYMAVMPGACTCEHCKNKPSDLTSKSFRGYKYWDPKKDPHPDDETLYFLCNDTLEGYLLSDREWGIFDVSGLKEPVMSNAFDYLVLDEDIKSTIKSLVWRYETSEGSVMPWSADFIKGKGEGQIFLLHGAPGVGKTCTAECVAELTQRPLLSITCGDMGTTPEEVEENLDEWLQLGELWGAILLLDEADIYLEQRDSENLPRNALVSVFLRALEYYKGILFLTTNRVGTFDDAFISRIHVALHYRDLTDTDREKIWNNNFERLENEKRPKRIKIPISTKEYATESKEMMEIKWNGREIRNAFQTAVALAEYEANKDGAEIVTLKDRHLKSVVKMSKNFKEYLRSTHKNQDSSKRARMFEWRNDNFGKQES